MKKYRSIYREQLMEYLIQKGHKLVKQDYSLEDEDKTVYYFGLDPTIDQDITDYLEGGKR